MKNKTFIDGTTECPVCANIMSRFHYRKNFISNGKEKTVSKGTGFMCMKCYRMRAFRFWLISTITVLSGILLIIFGYKFSLNFLLGLGICILGVIAICLYSESFKRYIFDLPDMMERKSKSVEEFVNLLINEHRDEFDGNYTVQVKKLPKLSSDQLTTTNIPKNIKKTSILDEYQAGLSYLDECGAFDESKFRKFNHIIGNRFSDADITTQLKNAELMIKGMEELKQLLRSNMVEGISTFEELERNGIDLSIYDV